MRRLSLLLALLGALVVAPAASAEIVTSQDFAGRTITFDVRAEGVDVEWYAEQLRNAAHGDEIQRVRFLIVSASDLRQICGGGAAGCYSRGREARVTVPAGTSELVLHTLVHEYGHHIDASRGVAASSREPNGSASWWDARQIAQLLAEGKVSHTYSLGWERAIGEIFAEDYAQLHFETPFKIGWLDPPGDAVREALRKDLENVPATPIPAAPKPPVVITRSGMLRTSTAVLIPFELLGPGRRVTFTARVRSAGARVRMELRCSDGRTASRRLAGTTRSATIDLRELGPARCTVSVRRVGQTPASFSARLRLAVESQGM
jgi:hypothetical protein